MRFLALLLLLLVPSGGGLAQQSRPLEQPAKIAGTKVSLIPPEGFVPSAQFPGYVLEEEGASIMVTEFPAPLTKIAPSLSDPEQLKKKAMTLLTKESVTAGGTPGLLFGFKQSAQGVEYLKWVLLVGDDGEAVMVTATFSKESENRLSGSLRQSVMTSRWDKAAKMDGDEGLRYSVGERGALKFARRIGNMLAYTGGGIFPSKSVDNPFFIVGPSVGGTIPNDRKAFAEKRISNTASVMGVSVLKTKPITIDGLSGYEIVADAKDKVSGQMIVVYQVILFDSSNYYLMQGLISRKRAEQNLLSFKEMAKSFKRK